MKRIDRVFQKLVEEWETADKEEIIEKKGSSATEIAEKLSLSRANVSLELNNLVRDNRVMKHKGYPVKYIPREIFEAVVDSKEEAKLYEKKQQAQPKQQSSQANPFDLMIGSKESLKKAVSQAKAAVHYPPNGLDMLLLGPTGSGKTYFANKIYQYAVYGEVFEKEAPFISFNCADYYNNPQLLLSQLFGYVKGAFTGANEDQEGLVEKANHGVLLLDEVHRLPPEGQEMLFYFIDSGQFNRLGENGFQRQAQVLIICATTEDPESALLDTFLRRIPMTIQIPALGQRSLKERIDLVKYLFSNEAKRVNRVFLLDVDVINALINTINYGNVGQLKSQIQMVCAQAFLNQLHTDGDIKITLGNLPEDIRMQWGSISQNISKSKELAAYLDVTTVIDPKSDSQASDDELANGLNIYEVIEEKVHMLEREGVSTEEIHQYILTDLHLHVKNFVTNNEINYNLLKFVDPVISDLTVVLKEIAERELGVQFDNRFLYYIGMHLDSYFHRTTNDQLISQLDANEIRNENSQEYQVANLFKSEIEKKMNIRFPDIEVIYLTMLLVSIETLKEKQKVSVLVATHGNATATSMVNVATELLGAAPIEAVNMPLQVSPEELFLKLSEKIREIDTGCGVLMLVDMGSLAMMESKLQKETGVKIKTISHVTTSMVLDAVRKVNYMELDLNGMYHSVLTDFLATVQLQEHHSGKNKAIVSICTTGNGTAKKIEQMVKEIINSQTDETVKVITVSSLKMKQELPKLLDAYQIIATIGTQNPKLEVPHITLESIVDGSGEKAIRQLLGQPEVKKETIKRENIILYDLCRDTLNMYLVYLNPHHITDLLLDWVKDLQLKMGTNFSNTLSLKLVVHTAFAFERVVKQTALVYSDEWREALSKPLEIVDQTLAPVEKQLDLFLTKDEKIYIAEVLLNES